MARILASYPPFKSVLYLRSTDCENSCAELVRYHHPAQELPLRPLPHHKLTCRNQRKAAIKGTPLPKKALVSIK